MVACNVVSGASQALVAVLLLTGHAKIWELMALSAVNGASSAFFFPASAGIVPQTLPQRLLQQGNALLRMGQNSTLIFGAALGGALVAATSPGVTIAMDAASFLIAAVVTMAMTIPAAAPTERSSMLADLRVGWGEFWSRTWLWAIVLQFGITNAAERPVRSTCSGPLWRKRISGVQQPGERSSRARPSA